MYVCVGNSTAVLVMVDTDHPLPLLRRVPLLRRCQEIFRTTLAESAKLVYATCRLAREPGGWCG